MVSFLCREYASIIPIYRSCTYLHRHVLMNSKPLFKIQLSNYRPSFNCTNLKLYFSLFGGRTISPMSTTLVLVRSIQTQYNTPQVSNPFHFGWNPFQKNSTSQLKDGGNPNQSYRNLGAGTSSHQPLARS